MKRRILTAEAQAKIRANRVPNERKIIVIMGDMFVTAESIIPRIPRDKSDPMYAIAATEFSKFYNTVLKFIKSIPQITVFSEENSTYSGSVSQYVRFTIDDPNTGSPVHYMFELRTSDHILPEDWMEFSYMRLMGIIDEYESNTGDHLDPVPYDFIVGYKDDGEATHLSYDEALKEVEDLIRGIVSEYTE